MRGLYRGQFPKEFDQRSLEFYIVAARGKSDEIQRGAAVDIGHTTGRHGSIQHQVFRHDAVQESRHDS